MFGIQEKSFKIIKEILEKNINIEKKVIFGSRATGKQRISSDIDIAIYGKNINFNDISRILGEIDESDIIYKVDIVHYESLNNEKLKENIKKEGVEF